MKLDNASHRLSFLIVVTILLAAFLYATPALEDMNLLSGKYPPEKLHEIIIPAQDWHPYPRAAERAEWDKLPERIRLAHIRRAEEHIGAEWETPKASVFLEYVRNGNRTNYQRIANLRRSRLADLVLGECFEGRGRFLDDIMNGVWTIAEETYWGVPAHVGAQKRGSGLPDVTEPTVDLFAAETAMLLAWTDYLLGPELDRISPLVRERIRYEVDRRIITPNLDRDDFWWMGFSGRTVNNWNPWICSNWLTCVLILETDEARRIESIHKILRCLDQFVNPYPRDGGCDEGPGYWSRAGASLYDCLELLQSASAGKIDVFETPLIQEMGRYIYRVHIAGPYFINFADAAAKAGPDPGVVYRYGKAIGDATMMGFASFLAGQKKLGEGYVPGQFGTLGRTLPTLFRLEELRSSAPREPLLRDFWLPDLEVMGARSREGSTESFYVAAKGGHNAESHNHNDVGNFIVYHDGLPVLIDVGVETYTAKTFSDRRYEIWTMQSAYHNLPTINGVMQKDGREFSASDINYRADKNIVFFGLDISRAYPSEADVKSWKRSITFERGKEVAIRDRYLLKEAKKELEMTLMSWRVPILEAEGKIKLDLPEGIGTSGFSGMKGGTGVARLTGMEDGGENHSNRELVDASLKPLYILYDHAKFSATIEPIALEDPQLRASWGKQVYRILLTAKKRPLADDFVIRLVQK
jgi:hypothetical protein